MLNELRKSMSDTNFYYCDLLLLLSCIVIIMPAQCGVRRSFNRPNSYLPHENPCAGMTASAFTY